MARLGKRCDRARALAALACGSLAGCLVVPVPHQEALSRGYAVPASQTAPQLAIKSRSEVALLLGAPEYALEDDAVWAYHWTTSRTGLFVLCYVPPIPGVYVELDGAEHFVVFRFDATGQLLKVEWLKGDYSGMSQPDWRAALEAWLHPERFPPPDPKLRPELKVEMPASHAAAAGPTKGAP